MAGLRVDPETLAALPESQRTLVLEELKVVESAFKENPLLGYWPHEKQIVFHSPPFPSLRAFFGGNRSGKTTAAVLDSIVQAVDAEVVPEHLKRFKRWDPPFFCRVMTPDLTGTMDGAVHEKIREWCPRGQLRGGSFDRAFDKVQRKLSFKNGSWVQFNSSEQDREKLGGIALHRVVYDEEPRQEARNECMTRLIDYDGEEIFALTPFEGMAWLYDEVYEPWERGELRAEDGRVVVVDMDDNPHLSEKGKARALAQYGPEEREARKSGRFVSFEGLVFPQFGRRHVVPRRADLPAGVEFFEGLDPGQRHMAAVLFCFLDDQDALTVYDELALQGKTVAEVCRAIHEKRLRWGVKPRWTVIDPSARNKNHQTGRSDQMEYQEHGVPTIPGQNSVTAGINRVRERLESEDRLVVWANCRELQAEFKRYRWAKNSRSEDEPKERPVKKDDHLLDALRYVCMQRPLVPEHEVRRPTMTMKDRLLRASLKQLSALGGARIEHDSGPGIFS